MALPTTPAMQTLALEQFRRAMHNATMATIEFGKFTLPTGFARYPQRWGRFKRKIARPEMATMIDNINRANAELDKSTRFIVTSRNPLRVFVKFTELE